MRTFLWKSASDPMQPSQQSAPRLTGQTDLTVVDGGLPSLMDSIRRCRTGG